MKIDIKATHFELTESVRACVVEKLGSLEQLVAKFDEGNSLDLRVEVGRTTQHHHKGDVFRAEANLRLPGKLLRAVHKDADIHRSIDAVKKIMKLEIEKYKDIAVTKKRRAR